MHSENFMSIKTNKLIKVLVTLFLILPALLIINGCSSLHGAGDSEPEDKTRSVIFGYFNVDDAPSWGGLDWVSVKQYKPKTSHYNLPIKDGLFYHVGAINSSIQVDRFGRSTRFYSNTMYTYSFPDNARNQTSKIIKKPGVYFLGSYKYKAIESESFFGADKFEMVKTKSPSEKVLLSRLLKIMLDDGVLSSYKHQIRRVKKRLQQLKK